MFAIVAGELILLFSTNTRGYICEYFFKKVLTSPEFYGIIML